jgi:hypothetical protein
MRKILSIDDIGVAVLAFVVCLITFIYSAESASAQSVFCPGTVSFRPSAVGPVLLAPSTAQIFVPNITQISGNCTNPKLAGAASGAALASQAIGDLLGSSANQETSVATKAIEGRRETPPAACAAGEILVDGICRARPQPTASIAPALAPTLGVTPTLPGLSAATALASPSPAIYDESFRIGSWAQGLGAYDHRTGDQSSIIDCCIGQPLNTNITPLVLDASSTTTSGGFVGGIDATKRGLLSAQDGFIFGLLGGYTWTNISLSTAVLSTAPSHTASGSSLSSAHVDGPSVGVYISYFNGELSSDFLIKNDFLSLSETQSQILGFGACSCFGLIDSSFTAPQSSSGSTSLNELTISDDINYRVKWYDWWWIEPTVGAVYVNSSYASSAAALGLADGYTFRLQGGSRIGMDSVFGATHVSATLTGQLFNDVIVHGNNIQGGTFGQSGDILSDQGKLQGQAIASINVDFGHGLSGSVQGDVYGARGIFGAGGQATLRMQW